MKTFRVNRPDWARGRKKFVLNELLSRGGKRCCLGFVLSQCGVPDKDILEQPAPGSLELSEELNKKMQELGLVDENGLNTVLCCRLMEINDALRNYFERGPKREEDLNEALEEVGADWRFEFEG